MCTGKTTLCAQILRDLQTTGVPTRHIAVVYGRYTERKIQTVEAMLGSILAQLFQKNDNTFDIPPEVKHKALKQSRFWKETPTLTMLQGWLRRRVEGSVFVLLDAVDEMDHKSRKALLNTLSSTGGNIRLLVTSRNIPGIEANLGANEKIEIRASTADLELFTFAKIRENSTEAFRGLIFGPVAAKSPFRTVADEILSRIVESAQDMYVSTQTNCGDVYLLSLFYL